MRRLLFVGLLAAAAAFFFLSAAQAATSYGGTAKVVGLNNVKRGTAVSFYEAAVNARLASKVYRGNRSFTKAVSIKPPSFGAMGKAAVKGVLGPVALIIAAAEVADWLFDEDGSATGEPRTFYKPSRTGEFWCHVGPEHCAPDLGALLAVEESHHVGKPYAGHIIESIEFTHCRDRVDGSPTKCTVRAHMEDGLVADMHSVQMVQDHTEPERLMSDSDMAEVLSNDPGSNKGLAYAQELARAAFQNPGLAADGSPASNPVRNAWTELGQMVAAQEAALQSLEAMADLNGDGALTDEEVSTFLEENPDYDLPDTPPPEPPVEYPEDYAREPTLQKVEEHLDPSSIPDPAADPASQYHDELTEPYQGVEDAVSDTELPGLPDPNFDFGLPTPGACQSLSGSVLGETWTFPGSNGCAMLDDIKGIVAWFLYVLAAIYIYSLFVRPPKAA